MWLFTDETKARYGQQKKNGFVEALLEIESNPETVYENRYRNNNRNDSQMDSAFYAFLMTNFFFC
jgi:hypothetical protein